MPAQLADLSPDVIDRAQASPVATLTPVDSSVIGSTGSTVHPPNDADVPAEPVPCGTGPPPAPLFGGALLPGAVCPVAEPQGSIPPRR